MECHINSPPIGGTTITQFMTTQTPKEKMQELMAGKGPFAAVFGRATPATTRALDLAVYGCLVAGVVGIIKAALMTSPAGVLICLLGSAVAFGLVIYVRLRKH